MATIDEFTRRDINQNSRPGRKPLLDEAKRREICEILAIGGTRTLAAAYVGCRSTRSPAPASEPRVCRTASPGRGRVRNPPLAKPSQRRSRPPAMAGRRLALERLYPERYARRPTAHHDPQVQIAPSRALGALGGQCTSERPAPHRRNGQPAVPATSKTTRRQMQIWPAKNAKSSGKNRDSAPPQVIALGRARGQAAKCPTEKPHNHREKRRFCSSAPRRRDPAGERRSAKSSLVWRKSENPPRNTTPLLVRVAKNRKNTFCARHRKIARPANGDAREHLIPWRGQLARESWHWLASARRWNSTIRQFLLHGLRKKASPFGRRAPNSGESSYLSRRHDNRYADCLIVGQLPSVQVPARNRRSSSPS